MSNVRRIAHRDLNLATQEVLKSAEKSLLKGAAQEKAVQSVLDNVCVDLARHTADLYW
jgi:hypothetical protein